MYQAIGANRQKHIVSNCEQKENTKMAKNYVHSTCAAPMVYPLYSGGENPVKIKEIRIEGGANVVNPLSMKTPTGVVTEVSDEDLELLKKDPAFQRHVARGFMRVMTESEPNTKDMQKGDNCRQLNDYEYSQGLEPRVPGSGKCQATCGEGDRIRGQKGVEFVTDNY